MNGRDKVIEDPTGANFPWGSLEPADVGGADDAGAITLSSLRYNRPFVWYHPGKVFPAPPPDPEPTEAWAVELLQPMLEAIFPPCPDKRMKYKLYMPEEILSDDAEEMILVACRMRISSLPHGRKCTFTNHGVLFTVTIWYLTEGVCIELWFGRQMARDAWQH
jgi:hypothetical protein